MRMEARNGRLWVDNVMQPLGIGGLLVDQATGQPIRHARFADTVTGEWEAWETGADGEMVKPLRLLKGRGPIRFIMTGSILAEKKPLTPAEEAKEIRAIAPDYVKDYKPIPPLLGRNCDRPGCHRLAAWQVSHEQEIDPGVMPDGSACERAVTVKVKKWCSQHFEPPTFRSTNGVEQQVDTVVRPQW